MGYYDRDQNTSHTVLSVLVTLFTLGTVIGLSFLNVELLTSAKNAIAGLFTTSTIEQQASTPVTQDIDRQASTPLPTTEQPSINPGTTDAMNTPPIPALQQPPDTADTINVPPYTPQVETKPPAQTGNPPGVPISEKPPPISISELEQQIHNLINVERSNNGLSPVAWDDALSAVARGHSEDMAKRNYFNHISPEGQNSVDRCNLEGVTISKTPIGGTYYLGCSENIFFSSLVKVYWYDRNGVLSRVEYYTLSELAELVVQGWMSSQGHRENILEPYWRTEGIGIAISTNDDIHITENFN
ncbi:CAP domain-containing protein [Chloroflexota bacterium]